MSWTLGDKYCQRLFAPGHALASQATITSPTVRRDRVFAGETITVEVASAAADVDVQFQFASDDADAKFGTIAGSTDVTLSAAGVHIIALPLVFAPFFRVKLTGGGGNHAGTTVGVVLNKPDPR